MNKRQVNSTHNTEEARGSSRLQWGRGHRGDRYKESAPGTGSSTGQKLMVTHLVGPRQRLFIVAQVEVLCHQGTLPTRWEQVSSYFPNLSQMCLPFSPNANCFLGRCFTAWMKSLRSLPRLLLTGQSEPGPTGWTWGCPAQHPGKGESAWPLAVQPIKGHRWFCTWGIMVFSPVHTQITKIQR